LSIYLKPAGSVSQMSSDSAFHDKAMPVCKKSNSPNLVCGNAKVDDNDNQKQTWSQWH